MRRIVSQLLQLAAELSPDVKIVVDGEDQKERDSFVSALQSFLNRIHRNEGIVISVSRIDEVGVTTLNIGISEHEAKEAIIEALLKRAGREAKGREVEIETEMS